MEHLKTLHEQNQSFCVKSGGLYGHQYVFYRYKNAIVTSWAVITIVQCMGVQVN